MRTIRLLTRQTGVRPPLSMSRRLPIRGRLLLPGRGQCRAGMFDCLAKQKVSGRVVQFYVRAKEVCRDTCRRGTIFINVSRRKRPGCTTLHKVGASFVKRTGKDSGGCSFLVPTRGVDSGIRIFRSTVSLLSCTAVRGLSKGR